MATNTTLNGEEAISLFEKANTMVAEVNEDTKNFMNGMNDLFERTNMPFVERLRDLISDASKRLAETQENAEQVLANLKLYDEQVRAISEGGDI